MIVRWFHIWNCDDCCQTRSEKFGACHTCYLYVKISSFHLPLNLVPELPGSDYCFLATFTASCPAWEQVHVVTAELGRTRPSACLPSAASLGCSDNVTDHVRNLCAGKTQCSFYVGSLGPLVRNCSSSVMPYLYVHHVCVPGKHIKFVYSNSGLPILF